MHNFGLSARYTVRAQNLCAVPVYVMGNRPGIQVTVDQNADNPFKASFDKGFLEGKKGQAASFPGMAQGGGGVFCIKVRGNGKNQRNNVPLIQGICLQQLIVELCYLGFNVFRII
jgi:hypothetical protein